MTLETLNSHPIDIDPSLATPLEPHLLLPGVVVFPLYDTVTQGYAQLGLLHQALQQEDIPCTFYFDRTSPPPESILQDTKAEFKPQRVALLVHQEAGGEEAHRLALERLSSLDGPYQGATFAWGNEVHHRHLYLGPHAAVPPLGHQIKTPDISKVRDLLTGFKSMLDTSQTEALHNLNAQVKRLEAEYKACKTAREVTKILGQIQIANESIQYLLQVAYIATKPRQTQNSRRVGAAALA